MEELCARANAREALKKAAPADGAIGNEPVDGHASMADATAEADGATGPQRRCWACGKFDERGDFKACSKCVELMLHPCKFCSD
eukprot:3805780-Prymnesium_polylepis.1